MTDQFRACCRILPGRHLQAHGQGPGFTHYPLIHARQPDFMLAADRDVHRFGRHCRRGGFFFRLVKLDFYSFLPSLRFCLLALFPLLVQFLFVP
ncbi:hypothetical protein [Microvirgula curvata]